jgi:raffinose/stachyose/melibiose transport system permease protein
MASTMTAVPPGAVPGPGEAGRKKKRRLSPRLPAGRFLLPAVLLYGFVFIVPFIGSLPLSFSDWNGISRFSFSGIGNFKNVVTSSAFLSALEHNAIMVGSFFVLSNVVALGLALLLNRRPAGYQVYRTLIFLPAILSLVATGFIWTVLLDPQIGVINPLLQSMGLGFIHPQWLASPHLALATVVLPLLRPAIVVTTVLTFVTAFQSFAVVYILEGIEGAPGGATDVVGTLIYRTAFGTGAFSSTANLGYSEANAVGVMVVLAVGLVFMQLYFRHRIVEL